MHLEEERLIYLDNAATSWPKPESVYQAMDRFMRGVGASPGRSGHRLSIAAGHIALEAREAVAQLLSIDDPLRTVFTSNVTAALNLALKGLLRPGDHAITTSVEHNSVIRPLRALEAQGVAVTVVECRPDGRLDPEGIELAIRPNSRLVVVNHASNVVGTVLPVQDIATVASRHNCWLVVDAAQTLGAYPVSVEGVDILAFTGHKALYGPQGTGGLYIRRGLEETLEPLYEGGTGSRSSQQRQPDFLPDKYESGTPNTVGLAGLAAGVHFVLEQGVEAIRAHEERLTRLLIDGLRSIPGVQVYGTGDASRQVAVVSFNVDGLAPSEVGRLLDEDFGVLCRVGLHCSPLAHQTIGTFPAGAVRFSLGWFNSAADVERAVDAVRRIAARSTKEKIRGKDY